MTISDFVTFIQDISRAVNRPVSVTEENVLHEIAVVRDKSGNDSIELECTLLWGVVHGARVFGFLYADTEDGVAVSKVLANHGLGCTWKRSVYEDTQLEVFVYAKGSALGKKVAEGLASLANNSMAQGTQLDTDLGAALGYPTPSPPSREDLVSRTGVMRWSRPGSSGGVLFSTNLLGPEKEYATAVTKCEDLWTRSMRNISPDITCHMEVRTSLDGTLGLSLLVLNVVVFTIVALLI